MEKFQGKYRIPSARLQTWDYGSNGMYFITICTKNRDHYFGEIEGGKMLFSEMGRLAEKYWYEIPEHFPFIKFDEFVVMPNHIHGILIIDKLVDGHVQTRLIVETRLIASLPNASLPNAQRIVPPKIVPPETDEPHNDPSPPPAAEPKTGGITGNKNPMFHENISRVIRWYKGRCSFEIRKLHADFEWQPRFHDHIIRDNLSYEKISNYIRNNPRKWNEDMYNPKNHKMTDGER